MADMRIREKVKIVSEAAKHGESVPEQSKQLGVLVFLLFLASAILVLIALIIGLFMNGHTFSASIVFIIAALLTYSIRKILKADDLPEL